MVIEFGSGQIWEKIGSKWKKILNLGLFYHATTNFNSEGNYLKHIYLTADSKKQIEANTIKQEKSFIWNQKIQAWNELDSHFVVNNLHKLSPISLIESLSIQYKCQLLKEWFPIVKDLKYLWSIKLYEIVVVVSRHTFRIFKGIVTWKLLGIPFHSMKAIQNLWSQCGSRY